LLSVHTNIFWSAVPGVWVETFLLKMLQKWAEGLRAIQSEEDCDTVLRERKKLTDTKENGW
jgi:hypothetical protein